MQTASALRFASLYKRLVHGGEAPQAPDDHGDVGSKDTPVVVSFINQDEVKMS